MKVHKINYYGLDHKAINKKFKGKLTYLNDVTMDNDAIAAVYKAAKPNRKLGHKTFMLLQILGGKGGGIVAGREAEDFKKSERFRSALHCLKCDNVIYSVHVHDFHNCPCGNVFVDGGRDYLRYGGAGLSDKTVNIVTLDLLTDLVLDLEDGEAE